MAKKDSAPEEVIIDVEEAYSKTEKYVEENKKSLSFIGIAAIVIFGFYFAYSNFYVAPLEKKAQDSLWKAEYYFSIDSFDLAINGDGNYYGFAYIADEFSGTKQANLAEYYLGLSYLHKSDFETAIKHLSEVDLDDQIIGSMAVGNIGDAYIELGKIDEAISYYEKAANREHNAFSSPYFLKKAAIALESKGDYAKAYKHYSEIKEKYPTSSEAVDIERLMARSEALKN